MPNSTGDRHTRRKLLMRLWLDLDAYFGAKWDAGGGIDSAKFNIWLRDLADIPLPRLVSGIDSLRQRTDPWPPALPEFREMCGAGSQIPKDDEAFRRWALDQGYGDARAGESWRGYRARIERRHRETGDLLIAPDLQRLLT